MENVQMGMTKRLAKTGTSYSVIIDRTIMKLLQISPETELDLSIQDGSLVITPKHNTPDRKSQLDKVLDESFEQFDSTYKKLAE